MKRDYTTGQVAKIVGVAMRTVNIWCDKLGLKHHRIPNPNGKFHRRIQHDDLVAFCRERKLPIQLPDRDCVLIVGTEFYASFEQVYEWPWKMAWLSRPLEVGFFMADFKPIAIVRDASCAFLDHLSSTPTRAMVTGYSGEIESERWNLMQHGIVFSPPYTAEAVQAAIEKALSSK